LNIGLFKVLILFKVLEINSQEYLFLWWSLAPGLLLSLQRNAIQTVCHFCLLANDKFRLSPLFTHRKINIGTDIWGKNPYKQIVFSIFLL